MICLLSIENLLGPSSRVGKWVTRLRTHDPRADIYRTGETVEIFSLYRMSNEDSRRATVPVDSLAKAMRCLRGAALWPDRRLDASECSCRVLCMCDIEQTQTHIYHIRGTRWFFIFNKYSFNICSIFEQYLNKINLLFKIFVQYPLPLCGACPFVEGTVVCSQ